MNEGKHQQRAYDEIWTPRYAVDPLLEVIDVKGKVVWEPTASNSLNGIVQGVGEEKGLIFTTSLKQDFDFLAHAPPIDKYDMIITNPPYSKKNQFIRRCFEIGKPFALLLPITALETPFRNSLFAEYGLQLLVLDKRINFTGGSGSWFNASWFCWNLLPQDLMFGKLKISDEDILHEADKIATVWD